MEPFRGQYPPDQFSPGFQYTPDSQTTIFPLSPDSQTTSFPYTPDYHSASFPLKPIPSPYVSTIESPLYSAKNSRARTRTGWNWRLRNFASKFWLWEVSACILTLGLIGLMSWQLKILDGQSVYSWDHEWSPQSSLALAVTVAKASMMIPVASALGQLKWHWFKTSRKLDGMEHFDEASRGVLGSLRLLWRLKFWRLASIGALITVSALSIDSLTQNAVHVSSVPYETSSIYLSYLYRVNIFQVMSKFSRRAGELPPSNMLSGMYYAITTAKAPTFEEDLYYCYSGNCTFGTYDSLAVDYECVNSDIKQDGKWVYHSALIDDGFVLNVENGIVTSNTTTAIPKPGVFKNLGPLIARWLVLANPSSINPSPMAMDCAFYWSVKTLEGNVTNGTFFEVVKKTWTNRTQQAKPTDNIYLTPDECWRNNKTLPKGDPNCTNIVDWASQESVQNWFNLTDFSLTGWAANDTKKGDKGTYWNYSSIVMQNLLSKVTDSNETKIAASVNLTAYWLSKTMTTFIRQLPIEIDEDGNRTYGDFAGIALLPDAKYDIRWRYLVFPILLVTTSMIFFIATVIFTWGEGGWKSSQLAVVFHGLSEKDAKVVGNVESYADMREIGKDMHVKLVGTDTGKKLLSRDALLQM